MNDKLASATPMVQSAVPETGPLHDVVFYPDFRKANPYQELLVASLDRRFVVGFAAIEDARTMLATNKPDRHVIFHLHWEDAIFTGLESSSDAWRVAQRTVDVLERFVDEGGSLIWTIHNERPHQDRFLDACRELRQCLCQLADLCIVHGPSAAAAMVEATGLPDERIVIVPHGHYGDAYDFSSVGRDTARAMLQLAADQRVFLLFGRLDAYKGLARLLDAFSRLADDAVLVIAGHVVGDALAPVQALTPTVRAKILLRPGFVPGVEVPPLFAAADVVVLPYEQIFTSGGLLLALSAGKPVIAPDFPTLVDVVRNGREGWLFKPRTTDSLSAALSEACRADSARLARLGEAATQTARAYPWSRSGRMTSALYAYLVYSRRPRRRPS